MTAPARSTHAVPGVDEPTIDDERAPAATRSSPGVVEPGPVLEPGGIRTSDAQAVVECVFDIAQTMISAQREISRRSLVAAQTVTAAVANAAGDAYRLVGPVGARNGLGAHRDGRPGG